jgi:hypothetical protein
MPTSENSVKAKFAEFLFHDVGAVNAKIHRGFIAFCYLFVR